MKLERWRQVDRLFHDALDREPSERALFLDRACAADPALREEIEALIRSHENAGTFLQPSPLSDDAEHGSLQLGSYELLELLGSGGMGEVYRAHDTKLKRHVAIKILPEEFSHDPERVKRFHREAEALAALNHQNIAGIYDLQQSGTTRFLVLELVEGDTLAGMLEKRGALPLDEALHVARQICDALEAAHERGIVHRDLKPGNVMITPNGGVKVLDFGLAKLLEPNDSLNVTIRGDSATGGLVLGTPSYISPEQARAKPIDKRTDIWAFGCVLYELLAGRRAFQGETVTDTLAAVVEGEPDWQAVPKDAPAKIMDLLRRCLQKDVRQRVRDIGDARIQIDEAEAGKTATVPALPDVRQRHRWPLAIAAGLMILFLGGLIAWNVRPNFRVDSGAVVRLTTTLHATVGQTAWPQGFRFPWPLFALSPNGRFLVQTDDRFNGGGPLYLRELDQVEGKLIPGTDGAVSPFFSPDNEWIGFWAGGKIKKVPTAGGPVIDLCELPGPPDPPSGLSWAANNVIVFHQNQGLGIWQVSSAGGVPKLLTEPDPKKNEFAYFSPQLLPGGKTLLFTIKTTGSWNEAQIVAQSLETGERRPLIHGGADARYVPSGHLLYLKTGALMAVPFDSAKLEIKGAPVSLVDGVMQSINMPRSLQFETGLGQFSVSDNGTLVYLSGGIHPGGKAQFVLRGRKDGRETVLGVAPAELSTPRFSSDGGRVAYSVRHSPTELDVWVYDIERGISIPIALRGDNWPLAWSPDGSKLAFTRSIDGVKNLFWTSADGNGTPQLVAKSPYWRMAASWSPTGLAYVEVKLRGGERREIGVLPTGSEKPVVFLEGANLLHPQFSPDGKWMAYMSDESRRNEVYVRAYPGPGPKSQISVDGGAGPVWRKDGREIFYIKNMGAGRFRILAVDVETNPAFKAGKPHIIFEDQFQHKGAHVRDYDLSPDGQHFIFIRAIDEPEKPLTEINVVLNWFRELQERVPVK